MTNKAKTYLKNIQEADTEKKLIGIEIAFKQDMTLSCNDLGSLCRAAEDKRYSLRNKWYDAVYEPQAKAVDTEDTSHTEEPQG